MGVIAAGVEAQWNPALLTPHCCPSVLLPVRPAGVVSAVTHLLSCSASPELPVGMNFIVCTLLCPGFPCFSFLLSFLALTTQVSPDPCCPCGSRSSLVLGAGSTQGLRKQPGKGLASQFWRMGCWSVSGQSGTEACSLGKGSLPGARTRRDLVSSAAMAHLICCCCASRLHRSSELCKHSLRIQ